MVNEPPLALGFRPPAISVSAFDKFLASGTLGTMLSGSFVWMFGYRRR